MDCNLWNKFKTVGNNFLMRWEILRIPKPTEHFRNNCHYYAIIPFVRTYVRNISEMNANKIQKCTNYSCKFELKIKCMFKECLRV